MALKTLLLFPFLHFHEIVSAERYRAVKLLRDQAGRPKYPLNLYNCAVLTDYNSQSRIVDAVISNQVTFIEFIGFDHHFFVGSYKDSFP